MNQLMEEIRRQTGGGISYLLTLAAPPAFAAWMGFHLLRYALGVE